MSMQKFHTVIPAHVAVLAVKPDRLADRLLILLRTRMKQEARPMRLCLRLGQHHAGDQKGEKPELTE